MISFSRLLTGHTSDFLRDKSYDNGNISDYQYKNIKAYLEGKLDELR